MKASALRTAVADANERALAAIARGLAWTSLTPEQLAALTSEEAGGGLTLETTAGEAFFRYYPAEAINQHDYLSGWLHVRFKDVARAVASSTLDHERLNRFSGKYNFMGLNSVALPGCIEALARLAPR